MLGCEINGGRIRTWPDWADRGVFEATIRTHQYLRCATDGTRLMAGHTTTGATIYACPGCKSIVDTRRVA